MGLGDLLKAVGQLAAEKIVEESNRLKNDYEAAYDKYSRYSNERLRDEYRRLKDNPSAIGSTARAKAFKDVCQERGLM